MSAAAMIPTLLVLLTSAARLFAVEDSQGCAVVYSVAGSSTWRQSTPSAPEPVHLFDWLSAGSVLEVGESSSLRIALRDGRRYWLHENSRVEISKSGPIVHSGDVTALDPVPPMPELPPISDGDETEMRSAAVRIRGGRITNLYPRAPARTVAERTVLRFSPVEGAGRYRVTVEKHSGTTVFEVETGDTNVQVPPGILEDGSHYYWRVRSIPPIGPSSRGEAPFTTLTEDVVERREALKTVLESAGGAESLQLLAAMDRRLHLYAEARDALARALRISRDDAGILAELEELDRLLQN